MYRCASHAFPRRVALLLLCALPLLGALPSAQAQVARHFPANALRGELVLTQPPIVQLNGKPERLAPGARIRSPNNLLLMPGSLIGEKLVVHYTREFTGLLMDVWVLNEVELANKTWPSTPQEAASWRFDLASQVWTKP